MTTLFNKRLMIILAIVLAVVAAGLLLLDSRKEKTPVDFGERFFGLVASGDVEGSYALTDQRFQEQTTKDQWQSTLDSIGTNDYGKLTKINSGNNQVDPTLITSVYETLRNGQPYEVTIQTSTAENGTWLVRYFWLEPVAGQNDGAPQDGRDE